jgi:hypothetical protein
LNNLETFGLSFGFWPSFNITKEIGSDFERSLMGHFCCDIAFSNVIDRTFKKESK